MSNYAGVYISNSQVTAREIVGGNSTVSGHFFRVGIPDLTYDDVLKPNWYSNREAFDFIKRTAREFRRPILDEATLVEFLNVLIERHGFTKYIPESGVKREMIGVIVSPAGL